MQQQEQPQTQQEKKYRMFVVHISLNGGQPVPVPTVCPCGKASCESGAFLAQFAQSHGFDVMAVDDCGFITNVEKAVLKYFQPGTKVHRFAAWMVTNANKAVVTSVIATEILGIGQKPTAGAVH